MAETTIFLRAFARLLLEPLEELVKSHFVHAQARVGRELGGDVHEEPMSRVEVKRILRADDAASGLCPFRGRFVKLKPAFDRTEESPFLVNNGCHHFVWRISQFGERAAEMRHDRRHQLVQERLTHAELEVAEQVRPAKNAADYGPAALVVRNPAVGQRECE